MAISTSSDWSLPSIHKTLTFNPSNNPPILLFISPPNSSSSSRIFIPNSSSSCPPPILQHDSVLQFDLKLQDFPDSSLPQNQDLNLFICNLFKDSKTEEMGFENYQKAKRIPDFKPTRSTLHNLIRYSLRLKNWNSIWSISQDFGEFNVFPDASSCCRLISSCIRSKRFKLADNLLHVFKFEKEIAVLSFNAAMRSYNKLHMYSSTVKVFDIMSSSGLQLDGECYGRTMEAYLKMGKNQKVISLFTELESSKLEWTSFCSQIYRILCESLAKSGKPFQALDFFREMTEKGFPEDPSFYSILIGSFAGIREVKVVEDLLEEAEGKKMIRDPAVFLKLVLMYIELGLLEKTLDVVSSMKRVSIRVSDCIFCAIINGFSKKRGLSSAAKVYEDLVAEGCDAGQVTYASVLNVYCRIGLYEKAEEVFWEMDNKGFDKCVVAYSSMIAMYGKVNRIRDAMRLLARMKERGVELNVWIYNSLLDMHGKILNLRQVEKLWKEMKRRKIVPDKVSYTSVISAYSKAREFDMCMKYYYEYRLNGGGIDRMMAGIMVGVYSKTTRVDELVKLLQDMKAEGTGLDSRLYRSSLNALRDAGVHIQIKWLEESFDPSLTQRSNQRL
ncbi:pentatricopeptide repeat-containing protein At5g13770, chloroplastic-like [Cynara cardunculus var. scolymus]|uniref:pentatricopeptide repeat-containing protein At5g13770, chloroplastic-like n=1 Tax=Cynara cardunculus var. scolymus TaxID=59895 RepID=UPI000D62FC5E|nr:pentatricopeptide repeat-containing protein At5g13770, chloroplastic-like [Cynara cardunculus var. scolymus]